MGRDFLRRVKEIGGFDVLKNRMDCGVRHFIQHMFERKAEEVDVEDLRRAYTYFMDEKRSVQWMEEQQGSLVFEDVDAAPTTAINGAARMDED